MKRSSTSRKNKLLYVTIIFFLSALTALSGCSKRTDHKKINLTKNDATINIHPLVFSQEVENKNKFILSAESANFFQEQGKGILNNFSITYIYNEGKKITISGIIANIDINVNKDFSGDLSLANIYSEEKITAVSSEGYNFETKNLLWNGAKKTISTKEPITFSGSSFKLTGVGLNAFINDEKVEITGKVDVTLTPESLNKLKGKHSDVKNSLGEKM